VPITRKKANTTLLLNNKNDIPLFCPFNNGFEGKGEDKEER